MLILFATVGMGMMASATDLLTLYVGLEMQSLAAYVLASFQRTDTRSAEAEKRRETFTSTPPSCVMAVPVS